MILLFVLFILCSWPLKIAFGLLLGACVQIASVVALMYIFPLGLLCLRKSRFATLLGRYLMRVNFEPESLERLHNLDPNSRYVFACEPHGDKTLGMALTFGAPGHNTLPDKVVSNCVVVAHWLLFFVPFVAQLFVLCGVVCSRPKHFLYRTLRLGCNFAVCPSGLKGKFATLQRRDEDVPKSLTGKRIIQVVQRAQRLGFCSLAARYKAKIVPVLSLHEDVAYYHLFQSLRVPMLVCTVGSLVFFPICERLDVRVGMPIDTDGYNSENSGEMSMLAARYYKALQDLAEPDYCVFLE